MDITASELLAALQELAATTEPESGVPEGYWTSEGMLRSTGISKNKYYTMMHAVQRMGRLDRVVTVQTAMDGRQCKVPAYGILPEEIQSQRGKDAERGQE